MKKYICMVFVFGIVFLSGCERRGEESSEESQEIFSEKNKNSDRNEPKKEAGIQAEETLYDDGRPQEEKSIYSGLAVHQKYFPGKTKNAFEALNQSNTLVTMYQTHAHFLDLWEYWIEQKHNPDINDRDGIMKISGKMYEEHEHKIREIIEASKQIKDQWNTIDAEIMKSCQAQKASVLCE